MILRCRLRVSNLHGYSLQVQWALSAVGPAISLATTIHLISYLDVTNSEFIAEEKLVNPEIAEGQGYSESKWVSERILDRAFRSTSLQPIAVRVGQICGGVNGSWNASDWVPALIKSSITLGWLPDIPGVSIFILSIFADLFILYVIEGDFVDSRRYRR